MKRPVKKRFFTSTFGRAFLVCAGALVAIHPIVGRAGERDGSGEAQGVVGSNFDSAPSMRTAAAYSGRHNGSAIVVVSGGEVVFEEYARGAGAQEPHRLASGTKSFWGVVAMAAVEDGLLTLDEIVADTLVEWQDDPSKSRIRVRHLLDFTSGLDPAVRLLRGDPKSDDKFKLVLGVRSLDTPGNSFAYGPSHLFAFGAFLQRKLKAAGRLSDPVVYLKERILDPIGMRVGHWTRDAAGNPIMPAGAYVAPLEWAKFGELLNKKGAWKGRQIVASNLISQVFEGSRANAAYGLTLWLNQDGPHDLAMAAGAGKQRLYVIPSRDLVIVRQGESRGDGWSDNEFLSLVLSGTGSAAREVPAVVAPDVDEWRAACAPEIERFCQLVEGDDRRLWRCLRDHKAELSPGCILAARAARRGLDGP